MKRVEKIAIFASGLGSNAKRLIEAVEAKYNMEVVVLVSNKPNCQVLLWAKDQGMHTIVISSDFEVEGTPALHILQGLGVHWIVLAGFLKKIPESLIAAYPERILNLHPALLPKFGGKGMYGRHVHNAVKAAGERETGFTIHLVNEVYDEGRIQVQKKCSLGPEDSAEDIENKVRSLEAEWFAPCIIKIIEDGLQH